MIHAYRVRLQVLDSIAVESTGFQSLLEHRRAQLQRELLCTAAIRYRAKALTRALTITRSQ